MSARNALLILFAIMLGGSAAYAQPNHPHSPHDTIRTKDVTVTYGRPYKKGREIFGAAIAPYGKTYRCGADEPTKVTFAKDVLFAGKPVKAGTYSFFAVPEKDKWTIILNSNVTMWGTDHDQHADQDVLKVDVPVEALGSSLEQLTMTANDHAITLAWDKTKVSIPLKM